jgi:D-amino peptidase
MKSIFIVTDIEGIAGITSHELHAYDGAKYLDRFRRLATAEVNAAIEGLVAVGVEDILILDGHGPEGLWFEDLIPPARILQGRPLAPHAIWDPIVDQYEAGAILGQHAMAGVTTSNMNHTQSSKNIDYIKLNGQKVGEIAQMALYCGAKGMPYIFLSGEEDACLEAQALIPGIQTVSVKKGLGRGSAISLTATEARQRIRDGIQQAVQHHRKHPIKPLVWPAPYTLEKRYHHTDIPDSYSDQPGAERVDSQTVRFQGTDIRQIIYR